MKFLTSKAEALKLWRGFPQLFTNMLSKQVALQTMILYAEIKTKRNPLMKLKQSCLEGLKVLQETNFTICLYNPRMEVFVV